jgi:hypothetical protein
MELNMIRKNFTVGKKYLKGKKYNKFNKKKLRFKKSTNSLEDSVNLTKLNDVAADVTRKAASQFFTYSDEAIFVKDGFLVKYKREKGKEIIRKIDQSYEKVGRVIDIS